MSNQAATVTGHLLVPPSGQSFQYDADGNLTNDLVWRYKWDGENRLIEATNVTGLPAEGRRKVAFSYDYLGRRAAKWVFAWDSGANNWAVNPLVSVRFVYDQPSGQAGSWNLIAELDLIQNPGTPTLVRSYLWGTDLSGTFDKAGGVGGLLAITTHASPLNTHFTCFDGNGNVMALVNAADKTVSARYEYGPFGEPIRVTGPLAQTNPFRFSTKFTDEETGLVYYGYRYYAPSLGRWINRDPIQEQGGLNLYAFTENSPLNSLDPQGFWTFGLGVQAMYELAGAFGFNIGVFVGHNPDNGKWSFGFLFGPEAGGGGPFCFGGSLFGQWTNAKSVGELKGLSNQIGFSVGEVFPIFGADGIVGLGRSGITYEGLQLSIGAGLGLLFEIHDVMIYMAGWDSDGGWS
jgi:RHS repeat-associated protein